MQNWWIKRTLEVTVRHEFGRQMNPPTRSKTGKRFDTQKGVMKKGDLAAVYINAKYVVVCRTPLRYERLRSLNHGP